MTSTHHAPLVAARAPLQAQPFFSTPEQRLALARQRYFEEGVRPSGVVSESVLQSWSRCLQARRHPDEAVQFNPVTASRTHSALSRSRLLLETAATELHQLQATLAGTACTVLLTDPQGVVVHSARTGENADEALMPLARRIGVCLAEGAIGTNAPGVTAHTGQASLVRGGEHFFGSIQLMHCAAAPIRDVNGRVAGVLDVSSEHRPFGFDAAAVVGLYATAIENRLLQAQSAEHVVIHLQTAPGLSGTPLEGLVGVKADGRIAWVNGAAACLLGSGACSAIGLLVNNVFELDLAALAALTRRREPALHRLPNGLNVWLQASMQARDGAKGAVFQLGCAPPRAAAAAALPARSAPCPEGAEGSECAATEPGLHQGPKTARATAYAASATWRDSEQHLIEATLQACEGNVSKAARRLGVSRGLIYRHLRA